MDDHKTRKASDFYTINLENEQFILKKETLIKNVDQKILRSRQWYNPKFKFLSFKTGRLELECNQKDSTNILAILVEKDKLQVSCSCNTEVEMLCIHAYKIFEGLIYFEETDYFQQYQPNGLHEISASHRKYFTIKPTDRGLTITPKPELGSIYQINEAMQISQFNDLLKLPGEIKVEKNILKGMALSYIIMVSHKNKMLPFLLPCLGKLTKAENAVKGFMNFISGTQTEYDQYLGGEEKVLNKCCYNMWKTVEKLPGVITPKEPTNDFLKNLQMVFDLWQSIIPLLWDQRFVFTYYLHHRRELKGKPQRYKINEAHIAVKPPTLRFQLTDKGSFYHFKIKVVINNMEIANFKLEPSFFISKGDVLFLLPSLRDAAITEWMREFENRLTIFKEHFSEFENSFLKPLREYYDIEIISSIRKKK